MTLNRVGIEAWRWSFGYGNVRALQTFANGDVGAVTATGDIVRISQVGNALWEVTIRG